MDIQFTKSAIDTNSMHRYFIASFDGKQVRCLISQEALQDHFGASNTYSDEEAFLNNEFSIHLKAEELIEEGRFEQNGSILIRSSDLD